MSSHSTYDQDGQEQEIRRNQSRDRAHVRHIQHREDMEIFHMEQRRGRYAPNYHPAPLPPPPKWDGVKNSQIVPISRQ